MSRRRIIIFATASQQIRQDLHAIFANPNEWHCVDAANGAEALEAATLYGERITLFLLDAALANADGLEAITVLQASQSVDCPPVVLMLSRGETAAEHALDDLYIDEVIETPIDVTSAMRRLRLIIDLHDYQKKDVSYQHIISRDPLIGLLRGKSLREEVARSLADTSAPGLFIFLNVDNTSAINERSGHHFGDLVLVDVARVLSEVLPPDAIIGRPYGDTFCAFIPFRPEHMENIRLLETLKARLRREYEDAPGGMQVVTCCIGAAESPDHGETYEALFAAAELATSAAKQIGRDVLLFYTDTLRSKRQRPRRRDDHEDDVDLSEMLLSDWFTPILNGKDEGVTGYDYFSLPATTEEDASFESIESMAKIPPRSMIHFLRTDIKRFFQTLHTLANEETALPRIGFQTVLPGDQAEMLPQMLQEALEAHPVDTGKICISIARGMVLEMSRSQLRTLARDIRAMGFSFGIHHVGENFFVNACFEEGLFDRVVFSPYFTNDLLSGLYPPSFLEYVISYFTKAGMEVIFPATLSAASRLTLAQTLGGSFGYYGQMLHGCGALLAHIREHVQRPFLASRQQKQFTFRISDDRYSEIFARSGIIVMDWRPHEDSMAVSESFSAVYGNPQPGINPADLVAEIMHPDDAKRLTDLLLQVKHGRPNADAILRVRRIGREEDLYKWRRFFLISIAEQSGVISHVYCITFDVDNEHREMQDIIKKAETDPLTQLFNRGGTEVRIRDFLEGEGCDGQHALMIIDLDDFKLLNDRLGHIAGDKALQFFSEQMLQLFRRGDVIGRIGGDEFMVFMKNIASKQRIGTRADDLCKAAKSAPPEWNLGCTVGIARYPQHGKSFEELYANADLALYRAKAAGKSHYAFFTSEEEA